VTTVKGKECPTNINIPESEGQCEVTGPKEEVPHISQPLKIKQVNIGSEVQPKFPNIGDYWDEYTMEKVTELLWEYLDLFPTKFSVLKGIVGDLGIMKITLNLDAKPVKQHPYQRNPKYEEKMCEELNSILASRILEPIEESD